MIIKTKHCSHCKVKLLKNEGVLYSRGKDKEYKYYQCNKCNSERIRRYRKTEAGRKSVRKSVIKYEKNNPERRKAWSKAQKIPLKPCVKCGKKKSVRHHPDIKKPLFIVFLCHAHHSLAHKKKM